MVDPDDIAARAVRYGTIDDLDEPPIDHALAVYGTLRPGESNFDVVAAIDGLWFAGWIRGRRFINPAGRYKGYPAFRPEAASGTVDAEGRVPVALLVSSELPLHWSRLDDFEGTGYRRVPIGVSIEDGSELVVCRAYVYETLPHPA